jgi:hypothetical protein
LTGSNVSEPAMSLIARLLDVTVVSLIFLAFG